MAELIAEFAKFCIYDLIFLRGTPKSRHTMLQDKNAQFSKGRTLYERKKITYVVELFKISEKIMYEGADTY